MRPIAEILELLGVTTAIDVTIEDLAPAAGSSARAVAEAHRRRVEAMSRGDAVARSHAGRAQLVNREEATALVGAGASDARGPFGPRPGSPRVQSWIRGVINPLRDAVAYEILLLERGSLTWRFYSQAPERMKPIHDYVADSRYALQDLVRSRPSLQGPFDTHDQLLGQATLAATEAHRPLVARPEFRTLVMGKLGEWNSSHDPVMHRPSGAFEADKLPELVADRMINNDTKVGHPYTDAEFWNTYREAFTPLAAGPEFDRLRAATSQLLDHDRDLLALLSELHLNSSRNSTSSPIDAHR